MVLLVLNPVFNDHRTLEVAPIASDASHFVKGDRIEEHEDSELRVYVKSDMQY